jgi:hypothetical protein
MTAERKTEFWCWTGFAASILLGLGGAQLFGQLAAAGFTLFGFSCICYLAVYQRRSRNAQKTSPPSEQKS